MINKPVIILGAGGHAKVCIDVLRLCGRKIIGVAEPRLDKGEILDIKSIGQNIFIQNDQSIFVDYIYDPFIRSLALEKVLPFLIQDAEIKSTTIDNFYGEDHHVIHQSLRYLFIKRLNKTYQSNKKESIFIING